MYSRNSIPNQMPDEKPVFFLRRHWIFVFRIFLLSLFLFLVSLGMYLVFVNSQYYNDPGYYATFILLNSAYLMFAAMFSFSNFIDYYLDVWIITNRRVINIEQRGLFSRQVSEKDLGRMQDITADVHGFGATIFGYGDVHIQTAGEEQRFIFRQVPNAEELSRKISNLVSDYRREHYEYPEKTMKTEEDLE